MLDFIEFYSSEHATPKASVIWMHGLGADGYDFANFVPELQLSQDLPVRFIFPHAPIRPVTLNRGVPTRAWYDIFYLESSSPEDESGLRDAQKYIAEFIEQEHLRGIPYHRIILGGFSQGGALALFAGLRYSVRLGGIIALSAYLPLAKRLPFEESAANKSTPIFMGHGIGDPIVRLEWGKAAFDELKALGHPVEWREYPMMHQLCHEEIVDIKMWIEMLLLS